MKTKVFIISVSAILLLWVCNNCAQEKKPAGQESENIKSESEADESEGGLKLYGIKSGIIEYKHSGSRTGTSILYFDKYGYRSATYSDLVMNNQVDKGWGISFDETQYMYKEGSKQGTKMKNPMIESLKKVNDMEKFIEETYSKMGFIPAGTEKFLGKECRVYKGDIGKILIWNGIMMYTEMNAGVMTYKQEVTKLDINARIKPSVFELPKDITFSEMPGFGAGGF